MRKKATLSSALLVATGRAQAPAVFLVVQVCKTPLIARLSINPKDLAEDQFIHFIPEQVIRKRLRVTVGPSCEPLNRLFSEFVQMPRAQAAFAGQEEIAVLG